MTPVLLPGRRAEAAAVLAGVFYFLAFAGFDVWPLTFITFVPLILALVGQTPKRAMWLAFLTGLAMNLGGFYWLVNMLKTFSGFPLPLCLLFTTIVCAYQGGRLAFMGWLYGRATVRGWSAPIVFGAAFVASELVFPVLFPWYYAATLHKVPLLMQLADLGGPILPGLALVAINLGLAEPLRARLAKDGSFDRRVVIAGGVGLFAIVGYGLLRVSLTNAKIAKAESARVGMVQGNMGLIAKRENPGEGLRRHRQMTAELRDKGVDFVVWSETSATMAVEEARAMKTPYFKNTFTASLGVPTIFGAVLYRYDPDRRRLFNTALSSDLKGDITGRYDKQYLLAFGEYLPFGDDFPILYKWSPNSGAFSPGKSLEPVPVETKGNVHQVSVLICYEDILPGFTNRAVSHANPELLLNMTNDAWFGDTNEPWQHLALAKLRAVEHHRYLVRSTNSGVSAVIDPHGGVVDGTLSRTFQTETHDATIHWLREGTLYEVLGDVPWYLVSLATFVACFRARKRREPGPVTEASSAS